MNDEVIEKVLEFNIKVKTNLGNEKMIKISDIQNEIGSSLSHYKDDYDGVTKIEFKMDCLGFTMSMT